MLACLKTGIGKTEMKDIPIPEAGPGQMVVKMSMSTICGSDMHFLDEMPNEVLAPIFPGVVLEEGMLQGHEAVGTVHAVGSDVTSFQIGDRVRVQHERPHRLDRRCDLERLFDDQSHNSET